MSAVNAAGNELKVAFSQRSAHTGLPVIAISVSSESISSAMPHVSIACRGPL
jgi:hypothetical protein